MAIQPPPVPKVPGAPQTSTGPAFNAPTPKVAVPPSQVIAGAPETPEDQEPAVPISFWQKPFVQEVMPFLTSLMLHVGLIALAFLTLKAVQAVIKVQQEQVVIPSSDIDTGDIGGIPHPGLGSDASRDAAQDKFDVPDAKGIADKADSKEAVMPGGGSGDTSADAIPIAASLNSSVGKGAGAKTGGTGDGSGGGSGDAGGALAPYGMPGGGGGIGPKSNFLGSHGNARHVAYVCDASGSMLSRFDELRMEIVKSVNALKTGQQFFNVIFFQESDKKGLTTGDVLLPANAENKEKCSKFVEGVSPRAQTNPIPALELAFKEHPQLIFLLTDGDFDDNEAVAKWIADHNKDHKVKINTIAFITSSSEDPEKVLSKIAKDNGGIFKKVAEK